MTSSTSKRQVLVIGSQCQSLSHLSFLPKMAEDLHEVMIHPDLGQCTDAAPGGS